MSSYTTIRISKFNKERLDKMLGELQDETADMMGGGAPKLSVSDAIDVLLNERDARRRTK